jgi:anti-anti-sigma regulatory factor
MDVTRNTRGELVIQIDGTFDTQAATRLSGWLGEVPAGSLVVLDFSHVREFQDFGLAAMAKQLASRDTVQLVGLSRHQQRLLRYFGLDLDRIGRSVRGDDEALG